MATSPTTQGTITCHLQTTITSTTSTQQHYTTTPANDHNTSSNQHHAFLHQATTDGETNTVPHHIQHVHGWKTIDFSSILTTTTNSM
jgi:hypothetical protein